MNSPSWISSQGGASLGLSSSSYCGASRSGHPQFSCSFEIRKPAPPAAAQRRTSPPYSKDAVGSQPVFLVLVASYVAGRIVVHLGVGRSRPPWSYAERRMTAVLPAPSSTMPHLGTTRRTSRGLILELPTSVNRRIVGSSPTRGAKTSVGRSH